MIAVRLWGRLGNQLFQYSFGKSISVEKNEDLYFYILEKNISPETVPLNNFYLDIKYLKPDELRHYYKLTGNRFLSRIERKLISIFPLINENIYIEKTIGYVDIKRQTASCYDGYWLSYKYFSGMADELRRDLQPKESVIIPSNIYNEIVNNESVAIHIRRGDYLSKTSKSIYWNCGDDYYKGGISYLKNKLKDPVFYIFSDDIQWVRENFTFLPESQTRFIKHDLQPSDCIDITLMRSCRHNIISNSTFGWWGAYLGDYKNKIVIAPQKWYRNMPGFLIQDLIPSEWILM